MRDEIMRVAVALEYHYLVKLEEGVFSISAETHLSEAQFEHCAYPTATDIVALLKEIQEAEKDLERWERRLVRF